MTIGYTTNKNITNSSISVRNPLTNPDVYIRNPVWLSLDTVNATDQKVVGLHRIDKSANFVSLLCTTNTGTYTVNWGDGVTENIASNTQAYHEYDYNDSDITNDTRGAVTFTDSGDLITRNNHGYQNGMAISFAEITSTTGIILNKEYYVINSTTNTFQISNSVNGSAVALTTDGSGYILPYKQVLVTITPTTGNLLTIDFFRKHNQTGLQNYSTGWLDIIIAMPNMSTNGLKIGGFSSIVHGNLDKITALTPVVQNTNQYLFYNCSTLRKIDFVSLTVSGVATSEMFRNCYNLLEAPPMTTTGTTNWLSTFNACYNLNSVPKYDLSAATTTSSMFNTCRSLREIPNLGITSTCTNSSSMFNNCYSLQIVPLMDFSGCTTVANMFTTCTALITIPPFNFSSATTASSLFSGCSSLKYVPSLNLNVCTTFDSMFNLCVSLIYVPKLWTSWAGSGNVSIATMFQNCSSLIEAPPLDNLTPITVATSAFSNCASLVRISAFSLGSVIVTANLNTIFQNCFSLQENNVTGAIRTHSIANGKMSATALNNYYTNLGTGTTYTLTVSGNYGTTGDDPTIATAKGWTVSG